MAIGFRYVSAGPRGQAGLNLGLSTRGLSHSRTNPPQAPGRFWNTTQRVGWVRAEEMPDVTQAWDSLALLLALSHLQSPGPHGVLSGPQMIMTASSFLVFFSSLCFENSPPALNASPKALPPGPSTPHTSVANNSPIPRRWLLSSVLGSQPSPGHLK